MKIEVSPAAERELEAALDRYAAGGLQDAFKRTIRRIRDYPESAPADEDGFRFATLPNLPFRVVYIAAPGTIRVIAVAHTSREPGYWQQRS